MNKKKEEKGENSVDLNDQITVRQAKLEKLRKLNNPFPNDFRRDALAQVLFNLYGDKNQEELTKISCSVKVAGRVMAKRLMGKAGFLRLQDSSGSIQLYVQKDAVGEGGFEEFKELDLGDIVGASGVIFKTKTGELSVRVYKLSFLTKSLRPLPEKFHGLADHETRYRQRYLDLLANAETRRVFQIRSATIAFLRDFFGKHGFVEMETPMMHPIPGGALARPFVTHHNALDMTLYLRIAPELYLKRLVIGGIEKVFEINRNFRNEGISTRHNPEFTTLEFYQAYVDYRDLMDFTENLMRNLVEKVLGGTVLTYRGKEFDFNKPFKRFSMLDAIVHFNKDIALSDLNDINRARNIAEQYGAILHANYGLGKVQVEIFEKSVEKKLLEPTFITSYPAEISPLARKNDDDPFFVDRFEFYVGGQEIANGFSELNDPEDQAARFRAQAEELARGDQEAMHYDADYITALEYGLPPTAGEGIGIDRLIMLLTDSSSIRDVILFPLLKRK